MRLLAASLGHKRRSLACIGALAEAVRPGHIRLSAQFVRVQGSCAFWLAGLSCLLQAICLGKSGFAIASQGLIISHAGVVTRARRALAYRLLQQAG